MNQGWPNPDAHVYSNFQANNINFVYNGYDANEQTSYNRAGFPVAEDEDEASELVPQYTDIPQSEPFLSAEDVNDRYTEIQIGLGHSPGLMTIPGCDNCKSRRESGNRPVVYTCMQCAPPRPRLLCKRCAEKELSNEETSLHKPNHTLRKWQPTWTWDLASGLPTPMSTPEMEDFVDNVLEDNLRKSTFEARKYFDDRAIRCFLPAPSGLCRVMIQIQIEPIKSVKRDRDVVDHLRNFLSADAWSEVVGNIGASAYSSFLSSSPVPPRDPLIEPQSAPQKGELKLSDNLKIKRGHDASELKTLEVFVEVGPQNAIELVLQDAFRRSERYRTHRFKWQLKTISVTKITRPTRSFASVAQIKLYNDKQKKQHLTESNERHNRIKERMQADHDRREQYLEWQKHHNEKQQAKLARSPIRLPPPVVGNNTHTTLPIRVGRSLNRHVIPPPPPNNQFNPDTRGRNMNMLAPDIPTQFRARAASADYSAMLHPQIAQHGGVRGRSADRAGAGVGRSPAGSPRFGSPSSGGSAGGSPRRRRV